MGPDEVVERDRPEWLAGTGVPAAEVIDWRAAASGSTPRAQLVDAFDLVVCHGDASLPTSSSRPTDCGSPA